eukprot:TRINITY_DN12908_c0_g1_i1.p1 TRINITY_DN12908_c0_g1~~TRINITY_DN12908_c0_g1_i1.p1  ORF type:complete len:867 (+),score=182.09 TRINITY_DN12908_c0_g1_i1:64-2664(+)
MVIGKKAGEDLQRKGKTSKDGKSKFTSKDSKNAGRAHNPYEVFQNRRRRNPVLGERVRGERRDLARSRATASAERTRGILRDQLGSGRTSNFRDNRLGESGGDEKVSSVQRLVRLRQKQSKRSFAIDGAGRTDRAESLTIAGRRVDELDDAELRGAATGDSENEEQFARADGDGNLDPVEESKRLKAEAAKEKAKQEMELGELDADFGDIMGELSFRPPKAVAKLEKRGEPDGYDSLVRQLAFDRKVSASERLKTPEEVAQERAERLATLEAERAARAKDDGGEADEGASASENEAESIKTTVASITNKGSTQSTPGDVEGKDSDTEDDGDNEDEGGESEAASQIDEEVAGDEQEAGLEDDDDKNADDLVPLLSAAEAAAIDIMANENEDGQLPYKVECPSDSQGVASLVSGRRPRTAVKLLQRVRACTAVALAPGNRAKLKYLFIALVEYVISAVAREDGDVSARGMELFYALRPIVVELAGEHPQEAYDFFGERLKAMGPKTLPRAAELCCLKLISIVFPTTDFQHPITTPAALLADHWAARVAALGAGITDLVSDALMLWDVLYSFVGTSGRFSPAFFQLGAALLETCWASASTGRPHSAETAQDVAALLLRQLRRLAEIDTGAARIACDELVRPSLKRARELVDSVGYVQATSLLKQMDALWKESGDGGESEGRRPVKPLRIFETARPEIRVLDPIFHEEGDRPSRGMELSETKRLRRKLNDERRAAARQLARDAAVVQRFQAKDDDHRRKSRLAERARVRAMMDDERDMLAQLKTESGGGMDTSLGSYSAKKAEKKANRRLGGNATDRMGTPKDVGRRPRVATGSGGGGDVASTTAGKKGGGGGGTGADGPPKKKAKKRKS